MSTPSGGTNPVSSNNNKNNANNMTKRPATAIGTGATAAGSAMMMNRKRPPQGGNNSNTGPAAKKIQIGVAPIKVESTTSNNIFASSDNVISKSEKLKAKFLRIFDEPTYNNEGGVPNSILKERFQNDYSELVPIINELMSVNRLSMTKNMKGELFYVLVSSDVATKLVGLDPAARLVYQMIQKSNDMGIWTKTIRTQTNIEQQTLNKIFKLLESRKLIKPVKSVSAKSKKIYMDYNITPSKELTGGVWYSDLEFDFEFINELRAFVIQCVKRLNNGMGVTIKQILEKMVQAKVSKVELSVNEVSQLLETLVYDYIVEESGTYDPISNEVLFVMARRVTPLCEFQWWDSILSMDFKYRTIHFEDNVLLSPHEAHYHTA